MSALNNTFEEIDKAISGINSSIDFQQDAINIEDLLYIDKNTNRVGVNNITPTEALDITGNMKVDGYINQVVFDGSTPTLSNFPNNGDGGFYKDTNFEKLYLCYNDTGNFIFQEFNNDSFDRLTNTFSEIDDTLIGANSLTPTWSEIDSILVGINDWVNPIATVDQEISGLTGLSSNYAEIDYAANGVASLSVDFDEIDSGIGFVFDLNYNSLQVNSSLALANTSLQSGANVSDLVNDELYVSSGDNVSDLANDSLYVSAGNNISDLVNDELYVSSGDNVSDLVNDSLYVSAGDNVSDLVNDSLYVSSGDNVSDLVNDADYLKTYNYTGVSVDYTASSNDYVINATEESTITLPTALGSVGKFYIIKNSSTGVVTVDSSVLIDDQFSLDTGPQESLTVLSTNSIWITI